MNATFKRIFAALLLASVSASIGCGGEAAGTDTTAAGVSGDGTTAPAELAPDEINRENAVLGLPKLDFGETEINILYPGENVYAQDIVAEQTGEVVDEAVFARNIAIEELLNVKLNPITVTTSTNDTSTHLATTVLAGEDAYDLCSVHQAYTVKYVSEGYFQNFADDPYIDWEKPWWNTEYMEEMVVGDDRIYFLIGDISLMCMKSLACIYYNKDMYNP